MSCDIRPLKSSEILPLFIKAGNHLNHADVTKYDNEWMFRTQIGDNRLMFHGRKCQGHPKERVITCLWVEYYIGGTNIRFDSVVSHYDNEYNPQQPDDISVDDLTSILMLANDYLIERGHAGHNELADFEDLPKPTIPIEAIVKLNRVPKWVRKIFGAL